MADRSPFGARAFLTAVAAMLLLPLLANLLGGPAVQADNRRLAEAPAFPTSGSALFEWPRLADAYAADHFGLRRQLVGLSAELRWNLLESSPVPSIVRGRNGRIFLAEGDVPMRGILSNCGAWWPEAQLAQFGGELEAALPLLQDLLPGAQVLIVPTSPILYPQDLPGWAMRACAGRVPLAEELVRRLPEELREGIAYPRDIAATLPAATPLIPTRNFHWEGAGIHAFLGRFVERDMNLARQASPAWTERVTTADLAVYVPGVGLSNRVTDAEWSGAGVRSCEEAACIGRAPLEGVVLPHEGLRLERPGEGGRLLLLGDSFQSRASDALIGYFDDIIGINLNNLPQLPLEGQRRLWDRVTTGWRPDRVLMIVNDGNVTRIPSFVRTIADAATR